MAVEEAVVLESALEEAVVLESALVPLAFRCQEAFEAWPEVLD